MQKQKILIVDDEKDILELLEYNLEKEGYTVLKASDGEAAIALLKSNPVDMVLLDIMMPKLDGIETCRRMRDTPEGKKRISFFLPPEKKNILSSQGLKRVPMIIFPNRLNPEFC